MARKVKLAIFDNDLKATVKKYEISTDGTKIKVVSGGEGHFMPFFDNDSFIDLPKPWYKGKGWNRLYFVKKKGEKCVNFKTDPPTVFPPNEEELKRAVGSTMLGKIGKEKQDVTWVGYVTLASVIILLLSTLGVF